MKFREKKFKNKSGKEYIYIKVFSLVLLGLLLCIYGITTTYSLSFNLFNLVDNLTL